MTPAHPARHLLRAKDLVDARYREPLDVRTLARAARLSPAHFSREFRRAFGESPHRYLLIRRLERAAALLRTTDRTVADICLTVGLRSIGSFTTSFGRMFGMPPTAYRAAHPPAAHRARIPTCVLMAWARPQSARLEKTAGKHVAAAGGLFFATDDVQGTYEELSRRGVEFQQEPTEQPYGIDAGFRDPSGNQMRMTQPR